MLTRLRVQGFKNLFDVEVRFGPFTCIAGPNGAGKSNLFDAIRFLHLLTQYPIMDAVQRLRETKGRSPEPESLFTTFEGYRAPDMRFTADLIVEREVEDDFGVAAEAAISSLQYEVAFRLDKEDGAERLVLVEERLAPIKLGDARRALTPPWPKDFVRSCVTGRRPGPFVSTSLEDTEPVVRVHQEGHGGRVLPAPKSSQTVLNGMASSDYPTVLAAHREMQSWRTLLLEPSAMRAPCSYQDPRVIDSRGGNLPAAIHRLDKDKKFDGTTCTELANVVAELINNVQALRVRDDPYAETLTLEIRDRGGVFHTARSLSDGTLRFLVLATLVQDPQVRGVICIEEPENGLHPNRIPAMVRLLRDLAIDPEFAVGDDNPLRQVLVNTHSPEVVQNLSSMDDFFYLDDVSIAVNGARGMVAVTRNPGLSWRARHESGQWHLAPGDVQAYLGFAAPPECRQLWLDFYEGKGPE